MSTTYRAVVHCDAQRSPACYGLLELVWADQELVDVREPGEPLDQLLARLEQQGWQRSYRATGGSRDVCPGCWAGLHVSEHERAAAARSA